MLGRVITAAAVVVALTFAGSASAVPTPAREASRSAVAHAASASAGCPAGVPTQTLTVLDQARVKRSVLAQVTRAVSAQSMRLRAAWGTPV